MNNHIIVGEKNRCICGQYGAPNNCYVISCGDVIGAITRLAAASGQGNWRSQPRFGDVKMLLDIIRPLVVDVDAAPVVPPSPPTPSPDPVDPVSEQNTETNTTGPSALMRAKMRVLAVEPAYEGAINLALHAVCDAPFDKDGCSEDNNYARWTPTAKVDMVICNPNLLDAFKPDDRFYVDFTRTEAPAPYVANNNATTADLAALGQLDTTKSGGGADKAS